jgi:hypothetical protein
MSEEKEGKHYPHAGKLALQRLAGLQKHSVSELLNFCPMSLQGSPPSRPVLSHVT